MYAKIENIIYYIIIICISGCFDYNYIHSFIIFPSNNVFPAAKVVDTMMCLCSGV